MNLIFVHGWSVTNTDTYGQLPEVLQKNAPPELNLTIQHIHLGKYISFHDEVTVDDIARAFENARKDVIGINTPFSCITHSTGGPVMRTWIERYFGAQKLDKLPLQHLIMLAPANHGSALAQLGKARVGRIKAWFQGMEPGQGVLDWLEFGSSGQRKLNLAWLDYPTASNGFYPMVITGEMIDKKLYDYLNSYTGEKGSDGVVRVAAANLNYCYVRLKQNMTNGKITTHAAGDNQDVFPLEIDGGIKKPLQPCALEVIPDACHTGSSKGIMLSVTKRNAAKKPVINSIIESLQLTDQKSYTALTARMQERTTITQKKHKYTMVVVRVSDDQGNDLTDYDFFILVGKNYLLDKLPKGLFIDRQKNKCNKCQLTIYLDSSKIDSIPDQKIGFRVVARPDKGFAYYTPGEFRSADIPLSDIIRANESLMLDVELKRQVDANTFQLDPLNQPRVDFKKVKPRNSSVD